MKNTYFLVETDEAREVAEVIGTFTNKKTAIKECKLQRNKVEASNGLRRSEGSKERDTSRYYVTNSTEFVGEWKKVPNDIIVF